jgi:Arc/MetJ-type ribon-helix-helix transcriptional regulator
VETLQIKMTDGVKDFLQDQATKHGFTSPSDYLQSVLNELQKSVQEKKDLEASLLEAIQSPRIVADETFWAERRRKILDKHPELES